MQHYGDNFIPVIVTEESLLHTPNHPFCSNGICPCHEDENLISAVSEAYNQGLLTSEEATRTIEGKIL